VLFCLFAKRITQPQIIGLGLCFAGGVSNLIDRVRFDGAVVDFLNLGVKRFRTGIFNVADMLILTGAVILATSLTQKTRQPAPTK
jgi:signal peptidase II